MYAQLGDIVFEGLSGLGSLALKSEQIIAEHQLIEGRTRLQNCGTKADELALSMSINSQFANPEKQYAALKDYQRGGSVLTLINGQGEMLGEYVIKTMDLTVNRTNPAGQWVEITIDVSLIEDYTTDKQTTAEIEAKNAGFANIEKMPVKNALVQTGTDASLVITKVTQVNADAASAGNFIDRAKQFGDKANGYMDQAAGKIQDATNTLSDIQERIQNSLTLGNSADNLLNQIGSIQSAASDLIGSLSLHDLQTSLQLSSIFKTQIGQMMINAAPVAGLVATQS